MRSVSFWLSVLLFASIGEASADEFADVDPKKLARGVEILAEAWRIPTAVFLGATDDFAKPDETPSAPVPDPAPASIEDAFERRSARYPSLELFPEDFLYEVEPEEVLGGIKRRRRL